MSDLFIEWLEYKSSMANSPNTIKRHNQHYKKYFESSSLNNMSISVIDELILEKKANLIIKDNNLTRKEWGNIKTILNGMFDYAIRKKYISNSPLTNIKILVKFRQVVRKTGKTETYNSEELEILNNYLDKMYAETHDVAFYAVKLNFFLGLRVGELVALKWTDIIERKHLHVIREEVRNQIINKYEIVEHTKTNRDRFVVLIPKAIEILKTINHSNEYIFSRNSERITSRQIAYVLEKFAECQGIKTKSTHKMRKTYASNLNVNGVPIDCIRELLGHNNLSTTLSYFYNPLTENETYKLIEKAL